jgi:acetate kinase
MKSILTLNSGSSSIKFAFYKIGESLERSLYGQVDELDHTGPSLTFQDPTKNDQQGRLHQNSSQSSSAAFLIDWLEQKNAFTAVSAIGHRVVHGMNHHKPELVTPGLLKELHQMIPYDSVHLPREIELIETIRKRLPDLPQVVCFDTMFHQTIPPLARLLPLPRRYAAQGIRRYGFHGLSYAYLMEELERLGDSAATTGRVILAHLGNGASMAAVSGGKCIDTSMGFSPTSGLMMGTRTGDLDPSIAPFLAQMEQMTPHQFDEIVNQQSGLLGVSEISSDMRELLARENTDVRAAEAVGLFCYQAKKWLGSFSAVLGGLDTLVFSGGIGENAPSIRSHICENLNFLGIEINEQRNSENAAVISADSSRLIIRVIHTDEAQMIARTVWNMGLKPHGEW